MHHNAASGSESEADALSLRMKVFAAMGVALVLSCSVYSFIAVGRAFAQQECTPMYLPAKIDRHGRPSSDYLSYAGISICMKHETEGAASGMWGEDGFRLAHNWRVHWDYGWDRR
jgi:hypothetical protein